MKNNGDPKISIILPTFNRANYISETIGSIRGQTYSNWELIIIDDGSEDNTEYLVKQVNDERISFFKAGRIGIGGTIKNIGLRIADGELIAFIDSDDLWDKNKLEKQVDALSRYPEAGFCLTGGYNFRQVGKPVEFFYPESTGERYGKVFLPIFDSKVAVFTQALMFRKPCLEQSGYFRESNDFSDIEFVLNMAWYFNAVVLHEPLVHRRLHDENYINTTWERSYQQGIETISRFRKERKLPVSKARSALFRLLIDFGETSLENGKKSQAISCFLRAWTNKPISIVSIKKTGKVFLKMFKSG